MKWNPINRSSRQPPSPARTRLLRNRLARVNPRVATSCSADDDRPVAGPAATAGPTGPSSPPSMPDRCGRLEPDQGMGGRSRGPLATAPVHPAAGRPLERRQLDDREHAAGERATQWCGRQRVEQRLGFSMTCGFSPAGSRTESAAAVDGRRHPRHHALRNKLKTWQPLPSPCS
jgi:hypothetical protein